MRRREAPGPVYLCVPNSSPTPWILALMLNFPWGVQGAKFPAIPLVGGVPKSATYREDRRGWGTSAARGPVLAIEGEARHST